MAETKPIELTHIVWSMEQDGFVRKDNGEKVNAVPVSKLFFAEIYEEYQSIKDRIETFTERLKQTPDACECEFTGYVQYGMPNGNILRYAVRMYKLMPD